MKKEKEVFQAITEVSDELVEEAGKPMGNEKGRSTGASWYQRHKRFVAAAACVVLAVGLVAAGVHGFGGRQKAGSGNPLVKVEQPVRAFAADDYPALNEYLAQNTVSDEFYEAMAQFSWKTASELLTDGSENRNYSPVSLYYALAMAAAGAGGETQEELLSLLGMSDVEELIEQCGNYYRRKYRDDEISKLTLANSIWLDDNVTWKKDYPERMAQELYAEVYWTDLALPDAGKQMGAWVAKNTGDLLQPTFGTDPETILNILNTIYFEDEWLDRFNAKRTAADEFYTADGETVTCDFMNSTQLGSFYRGDGFLMAGRNLKKTGSMIFVLPEEGVSVQELLASPEKLKEAFTAQRDIYGEIVWQIPKFDFSTKLDVKDALQELGVNRAFEMDADFSGITDDVAFLSGVRQESCISIDEIGVSAAAFTQIDYAGAAPPEDTAYMILNRPFLYAIMTKDSPLFIGVCENPAR